MAFLIFKSELAKPFAVKLPKVTALDTPSKSISPEPTLIDAAPLLKFMPSAKKSTPPVLILTPAFIIMLPVPEPEPALPERSRFAYNSKFKLSPPATESAIELPAVKIISSNAYSLSLFPVPIVFMSNDASKIISPS